MTVHKHTTTDDASPAARKAAAADALVEAGGLDGPARANAGIKVHVEAWQRSWVCVAAPGPTCFIATPCHLRHLSLGCVWACGHAAASTLWYLCPPILHRHKCTVVLLPLYGSETRRQLLIHTHGPPCRPRNEVSYTRPAPHMQLAFTQGLFTLLPVHAHTVSTNTATNGSCIPEVTALLSHAPHLCSTQGKSPCAGTGKAAARTNIAHIPLKAQCHTLHVLLAVIAQTWPGVNQLLCGRRSASWRMQAACWLQALHHPPPPLLLLTCQGLLGNLAGPQCARHW